MLRKLAFAVSVLFIGAIATLVILVAVVDFNRLKPFITTRVASFSGRELEIGGDLEVYRSWSPRVETSDIRFENASWAQEPAFVTIEHLSFQIRLLDLLRGRVVLPFLQVDGLQVALEKDAQGHVNWQPAGASPAEVATKAVLPEGRTDFPMIHELQVRNARIVYRAAGEEVTDVQIEHAAGRSDHTGVRLQARGTYQSRPTTLEIDGDPIGRLWASERAYAVQLGLESGAPPDAPKEEFSAHVDGTLTNAFDEGRLGLKLTVSGSNMAQLYELAGIVLPETPPYTLTGALSHHGDEWNFEDFHGRMGDSDLSGDLTIHTAADPPRMEARFVSDKLDLDDLAGLVGAPPSTEKGETASAEQKAEARKQKAEKRLFPDTPIDLERLHAMNLHARLDAKRIVTKRIPIDDLTLEADLQDGVLRAKRARFQIGGGTLDLAITLHGDAKPARAELEGQIRNVPLSALFKSTAFKGESGGVIDGRARLSSRGGSVRELAAHVSGEAVVAMSHGQISHLLVELIGLDIFESLGVLITKDEPIDIRCAIARFEASDGAVNADPLVLDTTDTKITGGGNLDLASEKVNLLITAYPKDFSPLTLRSPLRISGRLADLDVFPDAAALGPGSKIKQALSITLSAIVGLLPPLDVVLGSDSPCRLLVDEARSSMTKVSMERPELPR